MPFRLDTHSGVPPYLQLVQQVKRRLRYGELSPGDQLPTARELVSALALNPNTVLKAYRELELEGLVESRPGVGTFITRRVPRPVSKEQQAPLRRALRKLLRDAEAAGLDRAEIMALVELELDEAEREASA